MNRRTLIKTGGLIALFAPAIVRPTSLMPVKLVQLEPEHWAYTYNADTYNAVYGGILFGYEDGKLYEHNGREWLLVNKPVGVLEKMAYENLSAISEHRRSLYA